MSTRCRSKVKGWKKTYYSNQETAGLAILISEKADTRTREIIRDKVGALHKKGPIIQQDKTILNMNTPNKKTSKYMRQKLTELKGEIDKSTIMARDFNIPSSVINRSSR